MTTPSKSETVHAEVEQLARWLRMPYLRKAAADVLPTAKAQRRDLAEVICVLLAEEADGQDRHHPQPTSPGRVLNGRDLPQLARELVVDLGGDPAGTAHARLDPAGREPRGRRLVRDRQDASARSARQRRHRRRSDRGLVRAVTKAINRVLSADVVVVDDSRRSNRSAIGTLVERTTRYTLLVHLESLSRAEALREGLIELLNDLPEELR
jgi:hypothetical protein